MNILAIDTSGPVAGVCITREGLVAAESMAVSGHTHSESILPMTEDALTRAGMDIQEIDLFAVVTGPGSFTGVRIGVSLVKGLAHGAGKGCIGVNALQALAACHAMAGELICPIQDARGGQVYGAAFEAGLPPVRRMEDSAIALEEYIPRVKALAGGRKLLFTGDGVKPNRSAIERLAGEDALFAPAHMSYLRPDAVGALAWELREKPVDYLSLMPVYLRPPQAVRLRERMEASK